MNKIEAAKQEVLALGRSLHYGGREWTMSIPHRENDSDRVIMAGLEEAAALLRTAQRLRDAGQETMKALDELMTEFVSKKRAANWGVINHATVAMSKALASADVQALGPTEAE